MKYLSPAYSCLLLFFVSWSIPCAAEQQRPSNTHTVQQLAQQAPDQRLHARQMDMSKADMLFSVEAEARLVSAIQRYEKIVQNDGWPLVEAGPPLKLGDTDSRIPAIRTRLIVSGDFVSARDRDSSEFNTRLHDAVVRFQTRHGLPNEGYLGKQTITALNVRADVRLGQLRTNLERNRSLRAVSEEARAVVVNVPGFELYAMNHGRVELASRVVAGRVDRKTPQISAKILGVDILPTWRVPPGIAKRDMMPKLRQDPNYFLRENFSVIRASDNVAIDPLTVDWSSPNAPQVRFEQAPGAKNALGLIRIDMPNTHTVYLHDTPLKKLFDRASRPFSSGCVRVQRISELAHWLAAPQTELDMNRLAGIVQSSKPQSIRLASPVSVHLIYLTAWVGSDGEVNFREDIYKKDGASPRAEMYIEKSVPLQPVAP